MSVWEDIKDGLRFGPVRRFFARLRGYPSGHSIHIHSERPSDWADRILKDHSRTWESSYSVTEKLARMSKPKANICASCKRRGWHWEEYEANAGVMRRKATCIGNGQYHEGFQSDLDDLGGVPYREHDDEDDYRGYP